MKFFEIVPRELFSPLASPNRELYVDALDVLYTAYRENLKIREDTLYSMLRSRLEQQLADATFEGEDTTMRVPLPEMLITQQQENWNSRQSFGWNGPESKQFFPLLY